MTFTESNYAHETVSFDCPGEDWLKQLCLLKTLLMYFRGMLAFQSIVVLSYNFNSY